MENITLYLEYEQYIMTSGLQLSTKKTYLNHIRHLYSWAEFYDHQLISLSTLDIIAYKKLLLKVYAPSTINGKLSAVRNFYDYVMQVNYVDKNVIFNSLFIRIDKIRPQFLSLENRDKLYEYLSTKGQHIQLAFKIMVYCGLRLSEVTNINISDIERRGNNLYIHVQDFKTNKLRLCPVFDDFTSNAIIQQLDLKPLGAKLFDIAPRTLQHYAKEFSDTFNIKFSVHTCRHIYATERIRSGIRIELLKTLMGHKSINTTLMYIYIAEEEIYTLLK